MPPEGPGRNRRSLPKRLVVFLMKRYPALWRYPLLWMGKETAPRPPQVVCIETTNFCNGRCVYCPRPTLGRARGFMDVGLFQKIVDECAELGVATLNIHGYGEPLIDRHLAARIHYAKSHSNIFTVVVTNGSLLTERKGLELIAAGLDLLAVSLDPGDAALHNRIRRGLSYEKIAQRIRAFVTLKKALGVTHPRVALSAIVHRENENFLENFLSAWRPLIEDIRLKRLHNWGGSIASSEEKPAGVPCQRLWLSLSVQWDGRVSLCCVDHAGRHCLGDLNRASIREIWNGPAFRQVRHASLGGASKGDLLCNHCTLPRRDSPGWIRKIL